jgi:fructuronate reductase
LGVVTERLGLASLHRVPPRLQPRVDPTRLEVGIVHLGIGAFHRAHQAVYTEDALAASPTNQWGICGVTQRSTAVAEALRPQDCLYSVVERDAEHSSLRVIGTVREVLCATEQPEVVVSRLATTATRVVTITVTEKGYRCDPATGRLARHDPEIVADATGRPPRTVVGQLVGGLRARRQGDNGPLTVVSCDNLPHNGDTVAGLVADFCDLLPSPQADDLREWVEANVSFPNTMVDRIVPATTDADRAEASRLLGLDDGAAVVAEPFRQWVIEDRFAAARPAWEYAGAVLTDDVGPYEAIKLRLLNGSHSTLAYLGALAGCEYIADVVAIDEFAELVCRLVDEEVIPTLSVPAAFDLEGYKADVLHRLGNPALHHRVEQVAMDGSEKLPRRLLSTIRDLLRAGSEPRLACVGVAAWMRCVSARANDAGQPLSLDDPLAERFCAVTRRAGTPVQVVDALLSIEEIFGSDLPRESMFRGLVGDVLARLSRDGARRAVLATLEGR